MKQKRKPTSDAVEIMHRLFFEGKPEMIRMLHEGRAEDAIARKVYALRADSGLSQTQLAKRVGVTAKEIDDIEEADYDGNYLVMLYRIANALGKHVQIRCVTNRRKRATA